MNSPPSLRHIRSLTTIAQVAHVLTLERRSIITLYRLQPHTKVLDCGHICVDTHDSRSEATWTRPTVGISIGCCSPLSLYSILSCVVLCCVPIRFAIALQVVSHNMMTCNSTKGGAIDW